MEAYQAVCPVDGYTPPVGPDYAQVHDPVNNVVVTLRRDDGLLIPVHRCPDTDLPRDENGRVCRPVFPTWLTPKDRWAIASGRVEGWYWKESGWWCRFKRHFWCDHYHAYDHRQLFGHRHRNHCRCCAVSRKYPVVSNGE